MGLVMSFCLFNKVRFKSKEGRDSYRLALYSFILFSMINCGAQIMIAFYLYQIISGIISKKVELLFGLIVSPNTMKLDKYVIGSTSGIMAVVSIIYTCYILTKLDEYE